jgi:hypothetical protein
MKRYGLFLALALSLTTLGHAQSPEGLTRATLLVAFDLDGEAADDDQLVTAANGDLLDAKTFTITAQPDSCRLLDMTVTDANSSISAGVLTVVGTGCLDEPRTCSFTFAAGGSGVKTFTCTDGQGAFFKTVTSITTGTLTGEGGAGVDLAIIGYTSNSVNGWATYGKLNPPGPNGELSVNPLAWFDVQYRITTTNASSTTITDVNGADDAFAVVSVGDLLVIQTGGVSYERKVTAKASADSITVNQSITIPTVGVAFRYRKLYFSTNPAHIIAVPVGEFKTALFDWSVDANADTGGVVSLLECTADRVEMPSGPRWVQIMTTTVATGTTQANTSESIDLQLLPYSYCRFGLRFATGDDADGADEDINVAVTLAR